MNAIKVKKTKDAKHLRTQSKELLYTALKLIKGKINQQQQISNHKKK